MSRLKRKKVKLPLIDDEIYRKNLKEFTKKNVFSLRNMSNKTARYWIIIQNLLYFHAETIHKSE